MLPYEGSDLQAFNGIMTNPWGYVELMVTLGKGQNTRIIDAHFLVVLYRRVYNCIMCRTFATTLDAVASSIHLKMKCYEVHKKTVTISVGLTKAKRISQTLQ